ncbi:MAG: RuvB-like domain-containing protein [Candidatus Nezhaarchaeales archaeon]
MVNHERGPIRVEPFAKRRIGAHSHIRVLGLDEHGRVIFGADGLVGQIEAREAADIVVRMIKEVKMAGPRLYFSWDP